MFFKRISLLLCLVIGTVAQSFAQAELLPISHALNERLFQQIYFNNNKKVHTALMPYVVSELDSTGTGRDSLLVSTLSEGKEWQRRNWFFRKVFQEHLVEVTDSAYSFYLDFLPDLQVGKQNDNNLWLNTRGVELGGRIGKKFAFTSFFFENQAKFPQYYSRYTNSSRVVPGQGYARDFGSNGAWDYGSSGGTISYTPIQYLNVQLGYDKNFIGDGYRSLLLSDNAFNYPFLKLTATLGSVRYMAMWAQFIDFYDTPFDDDSPYPKKYGVFHYLSWNATKRLSVGLFENIMWKPRGLDLSYVNPLMLLRQAEYTNGSPDKALVGLTASYKIADRYAAYGQLMINEFRINDIFSGEGHYGNKQGVQLGIKGKDIFKIKQLYGQLEMNQVRPYSYSAQDHFKNYGHYGQPLAHPFGANFKEYLGILNYRYQRFDARLQLTRATYGLDTDGLNFGKDIYKSYLDVPSETGVFIGNGLKTNFLFADARVAYVLNPKNNLRLELGYAYRKETNDAWNDKQRIFNIGLRSSFRNLYSDF